jgi:hypothetical protein
MVIITLPNKSRKTCFPHHRRGERLNSGSGVVTGFSMRELNPALSRLKRKSHPHGVWTPRCLREGSRTANPGSEIVLPSSTPDEPTRRESSLKELPEKYSKNEQWGL